MVAGSGTDSLTLGGDRPQEPVDQRTLRPNQCVWADRRPVGSYRPAFAWQPDNEMSSIARGAKSDVVAEEMLAKVTFDNMPEPLPPVGELSEITVDLP